MANFIYRPSMKSINRFRKRRMFERKMAQEQWWCKNHPFARWLPGYTQCAEGHRKNELCERGE